MPFFNLDRALGLTLLGLDPLQVIGSTLEPGFDFVAWNAQSSSIGGKPYKIGKRVVSLRGLKTSIPVFRYSNRGVRIIEDLPCLTYDFTGCQFNEQRYIWKHDRYKTPVATSMVDVEVAPGEFVTGPALRRMRDNPEPYDLTVEIGIRAKSNEEMNLLQHIVMEQFPARGYIAALQNDGAKKTYEMYQTNIIQADDDEVTLADREQKTWVVNFTYIIETFMDNSLATRIQRTLTSPVEYELEGK